MDKRLRAGNFLSTRTGQRSCQMEGTAKAVACRRWRMPPGTEGANCWFGSHTQRSWRATIGPEEKSYIFMQKKLGVPSGENHTSRGFPDWRSRLSAYHLSGILWSHARGQHPSGPVDRITYITRIGQGGIGWAFLTHVLPGGGQDPCSSFGDSKHTECTLSE